MDWQDWLEPGEWKLLQESERELLAPAPPRGELGRWIEGKAVAVGERIPESVKNQLTQAVSAALEHMRQGSGWLVSRAAVYRRMSRRLGPIQGSAHILELPVQHLDALAGEWTESVTRGLTIEGAAAGASGWIGLAADIPILYCTLFKLIQEISLLYGFPVKPPQERIHLVQVLDVGHCRGAAQRPQLVLQAWEMQRRIRAGTTLEELESIQQGLSAGAQTQALARNLRLARQLALDLLERKLLQGLVILGSAIGAAANYQLARDVGWSARHLYRSRFLREIGLRRAQRA